MTLVLIALGNATRTGLNREICLSRTSRIIRVVGGSWWALVILAGMAIQLWHFAYSEIARPPHLLLQTLQTIMRCVPLGGGG
jgi:hypothetical protein